MRTLRQVLKTCTDEQFTTTLNLWLVHEEPGKKRAEYINELLICMTDRIAAHFVWERLTEDERAVLYNIVSFFSGNGILEDELLKKTKLPMERFQAALAQLKAYTLVEEEDYTQRAAFVADVENRMHPMEAGCFKECFSVLFTVGQELFNAELDPSKKVLWNFLSQYSDAELRYVAKLYDIDISDYHYSHREMLTLVIEGMLDADDPLRLLTHLDESIRALMLWLCSIGGHATMQQVRDRLQMNDPALLRVLHTLAKDGLAFDVFSGGERLLLIPFDLYTVMHSRTQPETAVTAQPTDLLLASQEPSATREGEPIAAYDIATLVGTIYQQRIEPTQTGRVPKRIATKLRPRLRGEARMGYDGEDDYLEILLNILTQLNVLTVKLQDTDQGKPAYVPGPEMHIWAGFPLATQVENMLYFWLEQTGWPDVYGVHFRAWDPYLWDSRGGRTALLRHLSLCEPRRWYTIASLLNVLWTKERLAFRPQHYFRTPNRSRRRDEEQVTWNACEGEVYIGMLASTLREMGLVSVGYTQDVASSPQENNPDLFMLTDLGADILKSVKLTVTAHEQSVDASLEQVEGDEGHVADGTLEVSRPLIVQPNFELLLLHPDMPVLYQLLSFARADQIGLVSRLTITKSSVLRGLWSGNSEEQMMYVLREQSQKELPQNVEYTLHDWTKDYRDVAISQVLLVEVSHEDTVAQLQALPLLRDKGVQVRLLGPTMLALIGEVDVPALRRALEKVDIVVRVNGEIFKRPKQSFYNDTYNYARYGRY